MRVVAFESRLARQMEELIRRQGGEPFVAPAMREVALESNDEALDAAEGLFRGEFDTVVLLTGVGVRALERLVATRHPVERFREALRKTTIVARGPKPVAALREMGLEAQIKAPEPNTWRELVGALNGRWLGHVAVQEYGRSNPRLLEALAERARRVTPIRIYAWDLPEDTSRLRDAARGIAEGRFDAALFTTPIQVAHLFRIAQEEGLAEQVRKGLGATKVCSIGPATTEMLAEYSIRADMEPTRPKMGYLVKEAAQR